MTGFLDYIEIVHDREFTSLRGEKLTRKSSVSERSVETLFSERQALRILVPGAAIPTFDSSAGTRFVFYIFHCFGTSRCSERDREMYLQP